MLEALNAAILDAMDALLGWLLYLPRDVALIFAGAASAGILAGVRPFTTNQDLLRRCAQDKRRLKQLIQEAKAQRDRASVRRYRTTKGMVAWRAFKSEGWPLLAAILPIALLATWCFQRLDFHPPQPGEPVEIVARFPVSAIGEVVHIVPEPQLIADSGWIQQVRENIPDGPPGGRATWIVRTADEPGQYILRIRYKSKTYRKNLSVGLLTYNEPVVQYDDRVHSVEVRMDRVRLFGVVPGVPTLLMPPWLIGYLLVTIPDFYAFKRAFRVY